MRNMALQAAFLGCGLTLIGIVVATAGMISLQPALRSVRWPSVPGEVISAKIIQQDGRQQLQLRYRYRIGDKVYTGRRISYHGGRSLPGLPGEQASAALKRYQPGSMPRVYYDPADPGRTVLEPGAGAAIYLPLGIGGLLFIVGMILSLMIFL
jgi:hypothetical protein